MKSSAILPFAVVALGVMECYVTADFFEPQADQGEHEYTGRYMYFPRDPEEKDYDDGKVENVEEEMEKLMEDIETVHELPGHNFQFRDRDKPKDDFENSKAFPAQNFQFRDGARPIKKFRPLGCYRENTHKRLLPLLVHNFRSGGIKWNAIETVVEKCYREVVERTNYKVFGVKFYGECWVGTMPSSHFKTVLTQCYKHAVGKAHTYYIYEVL